MAKIIDYEGKLPLRIAGYAVYPLGDDLIIRANSGFTTKGLKTAAQYEKCRGTAQEFGKLSSLCKQMRLALADILPKKNNLAVVNSLTKKMRVVMAHDAINARGQRNLATALTTKSGQQLLEGYEFNPDTVFEYGYVMDESGLQLNTTTIVFAADMDYVGFRMHGLAFDFVTAAYELASGDWHLYSADTLPATIDLALPEMESHEVQFGILEMAFFKEVEGSYLEVEVLKSVRMIVVKLL